MKINSQAFKFYKEKMRKAGFPVDNYSNKQLVAFIEDFFYNIAQIQGYYTDDERDIISVKILISKERDKKLEKLLGGKE